MNEINKVQHVIETYFQATYQGNVAAITGVFIEGAVICGFIDSEFYQWSVSEFAANIMGRPIAADIYPPPSKLRFSIVNICAKENHFSLTISRYCSQKMLSLGTNMVAINLAA